jgi:flagellar hook assembly protein FlgD
MDGRNPSSGPLELELAVRVPERVLVTVHDAAGRRVRTIAERVFPAGAAALRWDGLDDAGTRAAAGVYFVRAKAASGTFTRKVVRIPE